MRRRATAIPGVALTGSAVAIAMVALTGCGDGGPATPGPTATSAATGRQAAANPRPACFPNCRGKDLSAYPLDGADLSGGNFTGARWHGARLRGANLAGANLTAVDFSPDVTPTTYTGYWKGPENPYGSAASLSDLTGADLTGANLTDANLIGAILKDAILTGANLTRVKRSVDDCPWNDTRPGC